MPTTQLVPREPKVRYIPRHSILELGYKSSGRRYIAHGSSPSPEAIAIHLGRAAKKARAGGLWFEESLTPSCGGS